MRTALFVSVVVVVILTVIVALLPWMLKKRGVTMTRTKFGTTLIFESENADGTPVRLLNVNGTFQSVTYLPDGLHFDLACLYHRSMLEVIESLPGHPRVLVMGGGGYSLPKALVAFMPRAHVEVVEIDPRITQIAREQFFLDELIETTHACEQGRLELVNDDAWAYLRAAEKSYDVIVNDAFSGNRPLGPMKTDEGARIVREKLAENGVYLANVRSALTGRKSKVLREVEEAFSREFAHLMYVPEWPDKPEQPGNNTFVATNAEIAAPEGAVVVK